MSTIKDTMQLINSFLTPVKARVEKEAESSFMDTAAATPENLAKPKSMSDTQGEAGKAQTEAARASGSTAPDGAPVTEEDGERPTDDQGTKTLMSDEPVKEKGNIGRVVEVETGTEFKEEHKVAQKVARAEALGQVIMAELGAARAPQQKRAAQAPQQRQASPERSRKLAQKIASIVSGEEDANRRRPAQKQASSGYPNPADPAVVGAVTEKAAAYGNEMAECYFVGRMQRIQDEFETVQALGPELLQKVGGVTRLFNKIAEEYPELVAPDVGDGEVLDEGLPMEGEAPAGGGDEEAFLNELAEGLAEAGVTPDDMAEAIKTVDELVQAGVDPEDIVQAVMLDAEGGDPAAMGAPAPMM